jgi:predicted amidophosphoribosyltransferase
VARTLSDQLDLPMDDQVLLRCRYTLPQTLILDRVEKLRIRRANIRGSFMVTPGSVIAERILLVDDVWTSGATMTECGRLLKRHGAQWVWGVTLLRA